MTDNNIKIIHDEETFLVLNKPYGIVVNRSNTSNTDTIQDFIESNFDFVNVPENILDNEEIEEIDVEEFTSRSGIVHRLDKDTSGILLVAKDVITFKKLKNLFKTRQIQKEYYALVIGELKEEKIEIDAPIKRNPANPLKFAVVEEGKPALTLIEKIKIVEIEGVKFTLLKVFPKTGRTHQIRVHLAAIERPIVGDPIYLTKFNYDLSLKYFSRLMLHAYSLSFEHPYTKKGVFYSVELPEEFNLG